MEFIIGGGLVVVFVVICLLVMAMHEAREVNIGLTRQLKRKEGDLAHLALKNQQLRDEIATYPLVYTKPAMPVARRREDLPPMPGGSLNWPEEWS